MLVECDNENEVAARIQEALPRSRQKEVLRYLAGLKSDKANTRNLARLLRLLSGYTDRHMAWDWKDGNWRMTQQHQEH